MQRNIKYRIEEFCLINKYRLGGIAVATGGFALGMHLLQRGMNQAALIKIYKDIPWT